MGKVTGKVKWWSVKKGYGFLTTTEGKDVFCHYTGITGKGFKNLVQNQEVEFELIDGVKGKQAANCVPLIK